jgi:hypothetical protein
MQHILPWIIFLGAALSSLLAGAYLTKPSDLYIQITTAIIGLLLAIFLAYSSPGRVAASLTVIVVYCVGNAYLWAFVLSLLIWKIRGFAP